MSHLVRYGYRGSSIEVTLTVPPDNLFAVSEIASKRVPVEWRSALSIRKLPRGLRCLKVLDDGWVELVFQKEINIATAEFTRKLLSLQMTGLCTSAATKAVMRQEVQDLVELIASA